MSCLFAVEKSVSKQRMDNSRLLDYANQKRAEGFFNDVTIKVGNQCFPANRMVLSCYSKYFENMFQTPMRERYENSAEIQSVDDRSMKIMIDFFYTGNIVIDNENVTHLLSAADYLVIEEVKQYCLEFLESIITPDNCIDMLNPANLFGNNSFKSKVNETIEENFSDVAKSIKFKQLSKSDVISCLSNLKRNKIQETSLYEAIIRWTKHDEESRKKELFDLFQLLKLDQLSQEYLANVVGEEELVQENKDCLKLVTKRLVQIIKDKSVRESGSKIISLGGKPPSSKVSEIYRPSLQKENAKPFPQLPIEVKCHSSLNLFNTIYCIGGDTGNKKSVITDQVWKMDLSRDHLSWESVASLNTKRRVMGAALYKGTIVVTGGTRSEGTNKLASTECYEAGLDEWKTIAPLQQARSTNALVACDDCLYAVGGWNDGRPLSSVERLYGLKGTWEFVKSMQISRSSLAAVNCKGFIYAVGGGNDANKPLKTVEKYDPAEKKWVYVSDMNIERLAHAACVLQDKIYVVGGLDKENKAVKAIECYDPTRDEWSIVGETNNELFHHSLVVL